ncbi:MAG: prepilin-type N-terminal cleavage/methylation domain-containing protein [Armatimonadetes bacterium]|nr:prepilin-type N-terminal cleavage/methylation domain-containing protein [Armatimonadota bacterium]
MKRAFTLIELLVVIAIIAILAAILFPVFAQAKQAAKKTQDLNNVKEIGLALQMYLNDNEDTYPQAYWYANDNNSTNGYNHWSGNIQPYVKNLAIFVSPGDKNRGLAPTNFVGDNRGFGVPAGQTSQNPVQDNQAPRLSYTANSLLMPRKRRTVDTAQTVSSSVVDDISGTILIAPLTDNVPCINDTSSASNVAYKTHRSANPLFLVGSTTPYTGETAAENGQSAYTAISVDQAKAALLKCQKDSALGLNHIVYTAPERYGNGANYSMADSSAKFQPLPAILNPKKFMWGKKAYTAGGGLIYKPGTTESVE